jgi:hypothetical protein
MIWTEPKILKALAEKHYKYGDYFITRCKNGPSWFSGGMRQFDGVAIKKSWVNPCIIVYEVKCSRSDFMKDEKWPDYLQYCHKFMFVCPAQVIKKEDIDASLGVGLMWVKEKDGVCTTRTIVKPRYRAIDISTDFLMYIIMNKLDVDRLPFYNSNVEFIKNWLDNKRTNRALASRFKSRLIQNLGETTEKLEKILAAKDNGLEILKVLANKYGIKHEWDLTTFG